MRNITNYNFYQQTFVLSVSVLILIIHPIHLKVLVVRLPEHKFYWERGLLTDPKGLKDNEA